MEAPILLHIALHNESVDEIEGSGLQKKLVHIINSSSENEPLLTLNFSLFFSILYSVLLSI